MKRTRRLTSWRALALGRPAFTECKLYNNLENLLDDKMKTIEYFVDDSSLYFSFPHQGSHSYEVESYGYVTDIHSILIEQPTVKCHVLGECTIQCTKW